MFGDAPSRVSAVFCVAATLGLSTPTRDDPEVAAAVGLSTPTTDNPEKERPRLLRGEP